MDDAPSDEDEDEDMQPDDNDLLQVHEDSDDVSIMSFEKVRVRNDDDDEDGNGSAAGGMDLEEDEVEEDEGDENSIGARKAKQRIPSKVPPPRILQYKAWEYTEDTEELGVQQVFSEVGDMMKYVKTLRGEVRKLHATIRTLQPAAPAGNAGATGAAKNLPQTSDGAAVGGGQQASGEATKILSTGKRY